MQYVNRASLIRVAMAAGLVSFLGACSAMPGATGASAPGGKSGNVDPNTCGNYAATDAGRKLQAFLEATVQFEAEVKDSENYLRDTCIVMGGELGLAGADLQGNTKEVCTLVSNTIRDNLQVGLQAGAQLTIDYQPAVCTVNVEAAAQAAAQCEAKAEADVVVQCSGTCTGTCQGRCNGTCQGAGGTGGASGECNGTCEGTCEGTCTGGCTGHADVQADASCEAKAEVTANVEAECTEPELEVGFDAAVVVDASKVEAVVRAIERGLPRILYVQAKASGPLLAAGTTLKRTAEELAAAGPRLVDSLGEQSMCVLGQIQAAVGMVPSLMVSVQVQVEVSAEVQASAGAGAG